MLTNKLRLTFLCHNSEAPAVDAVELLGRTLTAKDFPLKGS